MADSLHGIRSGIAANEALKKLNRVALLPINEELRRRA
jgi:hypothetical protein